MKHDDACYVTDFVWVNVQFRSSISVSQQADDSADIGREREAVSGFFLSERHRPSTCFQLEESMSGIWGHIYSCMDKGQLQTAEISIPDQ